ncbi:TPA: XkdX family protein [Bacillus cereus]|uniref:XkdX family protein n=1 Tax=Bacillus TaxID=1386 RepID=UPI001C300C05|nr:MULTISPECIES: XkdX family protein [unclassified Bacillus (in: firmicutes)]MCP1284045.1 XkdX family protein [Bacillus sp. S0635]MCQ6349662.1 XkdX family protein [Bacillus cereus]HDX9631840.1 XkdX family protein [Bacillus cereus]
MTNSTDVRSPAFSKWKDRYIKEWCTKLNLCQVVELFQITKEEYKLITNLEYPNVQ